MIKKNPLLSCRHQKKVSSSFFHIFKGRIFIYFFFINLISNCTYAYTYHPFLAVLLMVCLSSTLALLETIIYKSLNKNRLLGTLFFIVIALFYTFLILTDYFCIFNFQTTLNQDKLDILRETTAKETKEFLQTYLTFGKVFVGVVCIFLMHGVLFFLSTIFANKTWLQNVFAIMSIIGFISWGGMIVCYVKFHNGFTIPQYTSITRIAYSYHVSQERVNDIKELYKVCKHIKVSQDFNDKPNVIVLIGESASIYHSGVFGYKYNTTQT